MFYLEEVTCRCQVFLFVIALPRALWSALSSALFIIKFNVEVRVVAWLMYEMLHVRSHWGKKPLVL